jgi:hypothetical protein
MPALRELERMLVTTLLDAHPLEPSNSPAAPAAEPFAAPFAAPAEPPAMPAALRALLDAPSGASLEARLDSYRRNVAGNFTDALRSTYPVIERLVGAEYFAAVARRYQRAHPSRSGDLGHVGEAFAAFLGEVHATDGHAYLADVARFEWLCEKALLSAAHVPLDLERLASVPPERYEGLRFALCPSLRLFESPYPVLAIWQANTDLTREPEVIDLHAGGDRVAIMRSQGALTFHALDGGELGFLRALDAALPLDQALDAAVHAQPDFDAARTLARLVQIKAIVDFSQGEK